MVRSADLAAGQQAISGATGIQTTVVVPVREEEHVNEGRALAAKSRGQTKKIFRNRNKSRT